MDAIQKTAIKETAKTVGTITVMVIVIGTLIELLSLQAIATIALLYCLAMCIKAIYSIKLNEAQVKAMENKVDQ